MIILLLYRILFLYYHSGSVFLLLIYLTFISNAFHPVGCLSYQLQFSEVVLRKYLCKKILTTLLHCDPVLKIQDFLLFTYLVWI